MPGPFRRPVARAAALAVVAAVVGVAGVGCRAGRSEPDDGLAVDTARFGYGDRSAEVVLTACGREDDVVVLAGAEGGVVVQAEVDLGDGGLDRTGVTADLGADGILGAFGAEMPRGPAGEITGVRVEGDRVIVEGRWVPFDDRLVARAGVDDGVEGRLVARCPETGEDEVAAPPG